MVQELKTLDEYKSTIANGLVVVDFTASWCPPCQRIKPIFEKFPEEYEGVTFVKVDVDENADTAGACGISCMPTFQFYKGGEKKAEIQGANIEALKAKVDELK